MQLLRWNMKSDLDASCTYRYNMADNFI